MSSCNLLLSQQHDRFLVHVQLAQLIEVFLFHKLKFYWQRINYLVTVRRQPKVAGAGQQGVPPDAGGGAQQ